MSRVNSQFSAIREARGSLLLSWSDVRDLTKLRLNMLVLVTTVVGYALAAGSAFNFGTALWLVLGVGLSAVGAGILNQYIERRVDALMPRTADRPLPAGRISPRQALRLGVFAATAGPLVLAVFVNWPVCLLSALATVSYLFGYTPLKRKTPLCTVVGALPGALPPLIGWVAFAGQLTPGAWALFSILFMWQLPHFFAIAWMYRDDYAAAGMPMLSLMDEDGTTTAQHIIMCTLNLIFVSLLPVALNLAGRAYLIAAVALGAMFLIYAVRFAMQRQHARARSVMFASLIYLPGLLGMWLVDKLMTTSWTPNV